MPRTNCLIVALGLVSALSIVALAADDSGAGDKYAKTPVVVDPYSQVWSQPLLGGGIKTSDVYTDGNLFITAPLWSTIGRDGTMGGDYVFLEPYSSLGDRGEVATSLGLSWRHLFSDEPMSAIQKQGMARFLEEGWFVGGNVFVDMMDTQHNNDFWQMGVGAEAGTRYFEVRGNYYIPMTGEKLYERDVSTQSFTSSSSSTSLSTQNNFGNPVAAGNSIVQPVSSQTLATTSIATTTTTVRTVTELFEKGMEGWDAEASVLVPWLDQWMDLRLSGGYFSFNNQPFGPQNGPTGPVHGWKAGAELRPVPAVVLGGAWYEDKRFAGSNWIVSAELQIPLDHTWKDGFKMRRRHMMEHLAEPVHRQNDAIKTGNREDQQSTSTSSTSVQHVTRVVSQTATRIVLKDDLIFVNNGGPVGNGIQTGSATGTGTAQKPVNTIQAGANIAATNNAYTSRVWNVYTQQSNVGPYIEDVLIGGSTNFISSGTLIPTLGHKFFGTGVKPTIMGTFSTGGPSGPSVPSPIISYGTLSYVGITGYNIVSASTSPSIALHNVNTIKIGSNYITNPDGAGIQITAGKGTISTADITGNIITQTTLCSCFDAVELGAFGPNSILTTSLTGNQITASGGSGVNVAVIGGARVNFTATGNTVTGSGNDGMTFTVAGKKALLIADVTGNTISNNGGDGINIGVTGSGDARLTFTFNTLSNNDGDGLFLILDKGSEGRLTSAGNTFSGNGGNGSEIVVNAESRLLASFTGDHFNGNQHAGFFAYLDGHSAFSFESAGGTFIGNGGAGVHIESRSGSNLFPSVISGATFADNGSPALDVSTTDNGFLQLSVVGSAIFASTPVAILARVGDGPETPTPVVNLALGFINDTISVTGKGASGIVFDSPTTGIGALLLQNTSLTVDSPTAVGIRLSAEGTSGAGPNVGAQIFDSTITVGSGPAVAINASGAGGVALDVENSIINSGGDGIHAITKDDATSTILVGGTTSITTTGGNGITGTASDNSFLSVDVEGQTINASQSGVYLTESPGATLNATVNGTTITAGSTNSGIAFFKGGTGTVADFTNNSLLGSNYGVYLDNTSATNLTANINGNQTNGFTAGIFVLGEGGDFNANINTNTVTGIGLNGIHLEATSGKMHINPSPTVLDLNTIDINRSTKLNVLQSGTGTVDGSIIINGTTLTPPVTFP